MPLVIHTSQVSDGSMKQLAKSEIEPVRDNKRKFLSKHGIKLEDSTFVCLEYEGDDYCRYVDCDETYKGDGMSRPSSIIVDAVVTTTPGHALFLPVADCIAAVLHDPVTNTLMMSHLGRHNIEQFGGTKSVEYLTEHHSVDPKNIKVWLSPAAGKESYPLFAFDNQSLHEVASQQIAKAGVPLENIDVSPIRTTTDDNYFSHSEFLKGNRPSDGRFAIVAVMT